MAVTREEVEQIAKATAREVVNNLHKYAVTYEEPKTITQGLLDSMGEEITAADWYRRRAKHASLEGDDVTAELYEHIAKEEDNHRDEFNKRILGFH